MKKTAWFLFGISLLVLSYALFIEPFWLEVTHYQIRGALQSPLKIAHITDLHLNTSGGRLYEKLIDQVKEEAPDLILISGDSYDNEKTAHLVGELVKKMKAPLGIWAVRGNWENWNPIQDEEKLWESAGAKLLINQKEIAREDFEIVGFDDEMSGKPNRQIASQNKEKFHLCLFHSPSFFEKVSSDCDLSFAGHTHGGQVRIPLWGPIWLPPGAGPYLAGWYEKNDSKMYISRGLGSPMLPLRFLARPELSFITVNP